MLPMWVLCGCLVIDPIEFEDENFPPTLVDHPSGTPIGRTVRIAVDEVQRTETVFRVLVRDRNRGQELSSRYRVTTRIDGNLDENAGDGPSFRIPETSNEADIEIRIPHSELRGGAGQCARLDLFVSSRFVETVEPERRFQPDTEGDLATATWWIWQVSDEVPSIDPTTCPVQDDPEDTAAVQQAQQP